MNQSMEQKMKWLVPNSGPTNSFHSILISLSKQIQYCSFCELRLTIECVVRNGIAGSIFGLDKG